MSESEPSDDALKGDHARSSVSSHATLQGQSLRSLALQGEAAAHSNYSHVVPFTANDVGTALVVLFHEPLKPMPL